VTAPVDLVEVGKAGVDRLDPAARAAQISPGNVVKPTGTESAGANAGVSKLRWMPGRRERRHRICGNGGQRCRAALTKLPCSRLQGVIEHYQFALLNSHEGAGR
jgi:hypothetical protein